VPRSEQLLRGAGLLIYESRKEITGDTGKTGTTSREASKGEEETTGKSSSITETTVQEGDAKARKRFSACALRKRTACQVRGEETTPTKGRRSKHPSNTATHTGHVYQNLRSSLMQNKIRKDAQRAGREAGTGMDGGGDGKDLRLGGIDRHETL